MTYDHEHHRIAIIGAPGLERPTKWKNNVGLAHTAFGFNTLADLVTSYEQKKNHNILPVWCVNHGMSTSMVSKRLSKKFNLRSRRQQADFRLANVQYYEDPGKVDVLLADLFSLHADVELTCVKAF